MPHDPTRQRRPIGLRALLTTTMSVLAALAVGAAVTLGVLTHHVHSSAATLRGAVEKVRLAEALEVDLLTHARATDAAERNDAEERLHQRIRDLGPYVTTRSGQEILAHVAARIDAYLAASRAAVEPVPLTDAGIVSSAAELQAAFVAIQHLVDYSAGRAEEAEAAEDSWDRLGTTIVGVAAFLILVGSATLVVWLRRGALRPIARISRAMERFGAGERSARLPERGPTELREVARRFNAMADAIQLQQERQLVFVAGIAHDLGNPLGALRLATDVLRSGAKLPEERMVRMLALVRRQVDRLERMVGDLLDTARIEAGRLELVLGLNDLRPLVEEAHALFENAGGAHPLTCRIPSRPLTVRCDPVRITQVLNNLISNAIKYSPAGSPVDIEAFVDGDDAVLRVRDRGAGIASANRQKIFEPFERAGAPAGSPGIGLGLSVAKRIVEAHGGRIELTSELDEGSTFGVRLPLVSRSGQIEVVDPAPVAAPVLH